MPCKTSLNQQSCWLSVLIKGLRRTGKPLMILYVITFSYFFVCCMQIYAIFLTTPSVLANFFFWNFFILGFSLWESLLFLRSSSEDTPSILHRYSIDSPSFRWRIDGTVMEVWWNYSLLSPIKNGTYTDFG